VVERRSEIRRRRHAGDVAGRLLARCWRICVSARARPEAFAFADAARSPHGRIVMLSTVAEQVTLVGGREAEIGGRERSGDARDAHGTGYLVEFRLEA